MRIITEDTNQEFNIDPSTELTIELTQPFFTDQGSQSLPITLPGSDNNLAIVGQTQRMARRTKLNKKRKVKIHQGSFFKSATMEFLSGCRKTGIVTTFNLAEGEWYSRLKDIKLTDIFTEVRTDHNSVAAWLDYLTKVMTGEVIDDFCVFPVAYKTDDRGVTYKLNDVLYTQTKTGKDGKQFFRLRAYDSIKVLENDTEITLPSGYAVTPFLRLNYVLKKIFEHIEYDLSLSDFETNVSFQKLVVLNNTADSILASKIKYSDLVPDCTAQDFLKAIRCRFGCDFYETEGRRIEARFFNKIYEGHPDLDLSKYIDGEIDFQYDDAKCLKLSSGRKIQAASVTTDLFQDFKKNNPFVKDIVWGRDSVSGINGVYYAKATGVYYFFEKGVTLRIQPLCPDLFDFCNKTGSESDRTSPDEHIPIVETYFWEKHPDESNFSPMIGVYFYCPHICDIRNLNSYVKYSTGENVEEKKADCPIMFCFSAGRAKKFNSSDNNTDKFFYGTTTKYDNLGNSWGDFNLSYSGEDGLFSKFGGNFEGVLQNGLTGTAKLVLPEDKIMSFRMDVLKMINGQPVLPLLLKYKIERSRIEVIEFKFITVKIYE